MTDSTIVAIGGGGFSDEGAETPLDRYLLELAQRARGRARPRVCFVPTASGDSDGYIAKFYEAFARRSEASHLVLFRRTVADLERFLLDQDVIYVGGGNTANMLAIWRVHGLDRILRRAWDDGRRDGEVHRMRTATRGCDAAVDRFVGRQEEDRLAAAACNEART